MNPFLRKLMTTCLPGRAVQALRKWHAPRVAVHFRDVDWPYAEYVKSIVRPGDTVIDVGANMGYITARLAEYVGETGTVIAIEPVPDTFAALQSTVSKLGLKQVQPIHACVSSQAGMVEMEIPTDEVGAENYYESSIVDPSTPPQGRRIRVPAITLDSLLAKFNEERKTSNEKPISFIKIDVEGHELDVISGATSLLTLHRPHLLIEVSGDPDQGGSTASVVFGTLHSMLYQSFILERGKMRPRYTHDQVIDYWFRPSETDCDLIAENI